MSEHDSDLAISTAASSIPEPSGAPLETAGDRAEAMIARLTEGCDSSAIFGKAEKIGDRTYITASTVQKMGGFGFGGGTGRNGIGGGGGGGGNSEGRPVAIIEISPGGVQVKPVLDFTKIGLAAIAAILAVWKLIKPSKR